MEKIRVMITDDHSLIREGLKQLLEFDGSIEIVGEASNGTECLEKLNECNPEVLLLDINMPEKRSEERRVGKEWNRSFKTDERRKFAGQGFDFDSTYGNGLSDEGC